MMKWTSTKTLFQSNAEKVVVYKYIKYFISGDRQGLRGPSWKYNKIVEMYKPGILVLLNYRGPQSHKR